jgi:hypothetical protein
MSGEWDAAPSGRFADVTVAMPGGVGDVTTAGLCSSSG